MSIMRAIYSSVRVYRAQLYLRAMGLTDESTAFMGGICGWSGAHSQRPTNA